jgi:hypothetical protein
MSVYAESALPVSGPSEVVAVDLREDRLGVGFAMLVGGIVPRQIKQRPVTLIGRTGHPRPDPVARLDEELQVALVWQSPGGSTALCRH